MTLMEALRLLEKSGFVFQHTGRAYLQLNADEAARLVELGDEDSYLCERWKVDAETLERYWCAKEGSCTAVTAKGKPCRAVVEPFFGPILLFIPGHHDRCQAHRTVALPGDDQ